MPRPSKSFKQNVWQLIFAPAIAIAILLSVCLTTFCLYELSKFIDMRGNAVTLKTARLIYAPIIREDYALVQELLEGALEDPFIRAVDVHIDKTGQHFHAGPEFLPVPSLGQLPNSQAPALRKTHRSLLYSHPITQHKGVAAIGWVEIELLSAPHLVIHYQTILITLVITLACLLIAAYLATRLFKSITTPLNHIKDVIDYLAQGKLNTRVNPQKSREFIELAKSINKMAEAQETAHQDLQNHIQLSTKDLIETLETIEIKNIELDIARKQAVEASRIKSEFLANTSHEIRTPLNGILGFAALALKTNVDEQQTEYLHTIRNSAQSLLTVINGILDFSKIEAGKLTLEYAPLPLRQTIDETLHILAPDANEKNLQLIAHVDKNIPKQLLGDLLRFKQVLSNLVSNAIKFSEQGNIIIRVNAVAQQETQIMLKVTINDQGRGLTAAQQNDLFKPFSQADTSASREQGGTGLGLAICKGLVERMQGEIGVESQLDQGSTFWFTARLGIDTRQPTHKKLPNLEQHRALICSNNPESLEQLQGLLEEWKMKQSTIAEIHDIFPSIRQSAQDNPFDVLILDISPNERKIQPMLLNNISDQLTNEFKCKVIASCTAAQQRMLRSDGKNSKTLFINKPVAYETLLNILCAQLNINLLELHQDQTTQELAASTQVLLVDDNPANLQLASELLRGLNLQVFQANNGLQAIEACKSQEFDVIFMDIQMPGMDGFETTKRIRELEKEARRTPIIALTAHSLTEQKAELLIAGMDDCISKPVSESQLAHIINRWTSFNGKKDISSLAKIGNTHLKAAYSVIEGDTDTSIDINLCLKLANNKPLLARDMLKMMLDTLPKEKLHIEAAIENNDKELFAELVHRLYGSCCYCGVPKLKSISYLIDKLLQNQELDGALQSVQSLYDAIEEVLSWGKGKDLDAYFGIEKSKS